MSIEAVKKSAADQSKDCELLQELVQDYGLVWVVEGIGVAKVRQFLKEWDGYPFPLELQACFDTLEVEHYPRSIIQLLIDNQHQPWLTPHPARGEDLPEESKKEGV